MVNLPEWHPLASPPDETWRAAALRELLMQQPALTHVQLTATAKPFAWLRQLNDTNPNLRTITLSNCAFRAGTQPSEVLVNLTRVTSVTIRDPNHVRGPAFCAWSVAALSASVVLCFSLIVAS